ncbi:GNAT family N-acetyltransferase [Alkalicoccus chagannorensis]|uniref:GNAT family N-acetyltransferase n=1 Tax=Alkalicoccus chagannorensis TaxID=427072 RepID=UPI0003FE1C3E|nr:GNAT family N-acetyltransferase [Alkalicoccus chagannorensis]
MSAFLEEPKEAKPKDQLIEEMASMEMQLIRLQQNIPKIAADYRVIAVDQTKHHEHVIVYVHDDGVVCRLMIDSCLHPYHGHWDYSIHATWKESSLHIDDIRGDAGYGYGSVLLDHAKKYVQEKHVHALTGSIVPRDWDHIERLIHFYEKHGFHLTLDEQAKAGNIRWEAA